MFLCLTILIICFVSINSRRSNSRDSDSRQYYEYTTEYDPLCCDGKDYHNSYHAVEHGIYYPEFTCDKGPCPKTCKCDSIK